MISLLARIFIKDRGSYSSPEVRSAYGVLCSVTAIVLNLLLSLGKFLIGALTGSISIVADAVNNLTDAGSSVISFIGFRLSNAKPDPEHPFGHGRVEYISGLAVSAIIMFAGYETFKEAFSGVIVFIKHLADPKNPAPEPLVFSIWAVVVLSISIAVKFYMAYFMRKIGNKIDSSVMKAAAADAMGDTVATFLALICLVVYKLFSLNLDAFAGLAVSVVIFKAGFDSARDTVDKLLGSKPSPVLVDAIEKETLSYPEILGIHDLIVHDYGPGRTMVSLHAEVDGNGNIYDLHEVMDRVANEIGAKYHCEAVVHMDPIDIGDETTQKYRNAVRDVINRLDMGISFHDLRVVPGKENTNLIFDMLVPFNCKLGNEELKALVCEKMKEVYSECSCVIKIDRPYL